jgi:hypothetical protein
VVQNHLYDGGWRWSRGYSAIKQKSMVIYVTTPKLSNFSWSFTDYTQAQQDPKYKSPHPMRHCVKDKGFFVLSNLRTVKMLEPHGPHLSLCGTLMCLLSMLFDSVLPCPSK